MASATNPFWADSGAHGFGGDGDAYHGPRWRFAQLFSFQKANLGIFSIGNESRQDFRPRTLQFRKS